MNNAGDTMRYTPKLYRRAFFRVASIARANTNDGMSDLRALADRLHLHVGAIGELLRAGTQSNRVSYHFMETLMPSLNALGDMEYALRQHAEREAELVGIVMELRDVMSETGSDESYPDVFDRAVAAIHGHKALEREGDEPDWAEADRQYRDDLSRERND
jgi:hypothetical protein